jgi:nucleoside-diphosphate-sugar epimerase
MANNLPSSNGLTILITGFNGYIASNLAHYFLTLGYSVRGTVRTTLKSSFILNSTAFKPYVSRIKISVIPDITIKDAFNEAVQGTHAIFHLATPINFHSSTKATTINLAVNGTLNLLNSAHSCAGEQLTTFIYTSSLLTLLDPANPPNHHYTPSSWNLAALHAASALTPNQQAPFSILYSASKILTERAVFGFRESEKPGFNVLSVVPAVVIGPPVLFPEKAEDVNGTIKPIWEVLSGEDIGVPRVVGSGCFVNVRDLVGICGWCMENGGGVDGKRVVVVAGRGDPEAMASVLYEKYPERLKHLKYLARDDGKGIKVEWPTYDTKDAEMALGRPWINYEKSVLDTAESLERYLD